MTTGERMKMRRKELGLSADQVAEALQVSRATIFRYEKGDIEKLPGTALVPLANVLHTTVSYLMGWLDDVPMERKETPASLTEDGRVAEFVGLFDKLTAEQQALIISQIKGILSDQ